MINLTFSFTAAFIDQENMYVNTAAATPIPQCIDQGFYETFQNVSTSHSRACLYKVWGLTHGNYFFPRI